MKKRKLAIAGQLRVDFSLSSMVPPVQSVLGGGEIFGSKCVPEGGPSEENPSTHTTSIHPRQLVYTLYFSTDTCTFIESGYRQIQRLMNYRKANTSA